MTHSRRANTVLFGFDFQVNAAIILMLENVQDLVSIKLEGNHEDIQLKLCDDRLILAQAKAVEKSSEDFSNVRKNLKKSLVSLSEGGKNTNCAKLIFITNSPNPLNDNTNRSIFYGHAHRDYNTLPNTAKIIINEYIKKIENPLDLNKFLIQVLPFETDVDEERYKVVKENINDFIGNLNLNIPGLSKTLMNIWHEKIFKNGTKGNPDTVLTKKEIMWPIIVIATDIKKCDDVFLDRFDRGLFEEIVNNYHVIIDSCSEKCEFFIKILYDYANFETSATGMSKTNKFIEENWRNYTDDLPLPKADEETQKGLVQIVLYNIIRNRFTINNVKTGTKL